MGDGSYVSKAIFPAFHCASTITSGNWRTLIVSLPACLDCCVVYFQLVFFFFNNTPIDMLLFVVQHKVAECFLNLLCTKLKRKSVNMCSYSGILP